MLRWGIAGLGNIAHRVAADFRYVENGVLTCVASRSADKAKKFAQQYGADRVYSDYEQMAKSDAIDAVYIATIHPTHYQIAKLFLSYGKHVMVEKPAVISVQQWQDLVEVAHQNQCFLMEAMKFPLFPAYRQLKQHLNQNSESITNINACFGNYHPFDDQWHLFDKTLYGGAKYDVGCYLLWLYVDLLEIKNYDELELHRFESTVNQASLVDERTDFVLSKPVAGVLRSSIVDDYQRSASITSTDSRIKIHGKWWNPKYIEIENSQGKVTLDNRSDVGGGFQYEFTHFADCVANGLTQSPINSHAKTMVVLSALEANGK
ncbi:Gfo/Idh/MocA family oxidoreductase [Vibrio profundum]|uniref:Gfo/Idh/MocA family protein n=1 Tax=Vibrio profundum TaxID=2910247 RepID=UPI003D0DE1B6